MRTVGYCRVSTEEQATGGLSLAAQESKVRAYADLYGLELVDVIVDPGVSAKTLDRPGLARALDAHPHPPGRRHPHCQARSTDKINR